MYHPPRLVSYGPPKWTHRDWWQDSRVVAYWSTLRGCEHSQHCRWWRLA